VITTTLTRNGEVDSSRWTRFEYRHPVAGPRLQIFYVEAPREWAVFLFPMLTWQPCGDFHQEELSGRDLEIAFEADQYEDVRVYDRLYIIDAVWGD
jgi:hypothetical protein